MPRALIASLIAFLLAAVPALAQQRQPVPPQPDESMRVVLVRDAAPACGSQCAEWISAEGKINRGTPALFRAIFRKIGKRDLPIFLHSPGGSVDGAIETAKLLRQRGARVIVARTAFEGCTPADGQKCLDEKKQTGYRGLPGNSRSFCASACPLLLAGAKERVAAPTVALGLHQVHNVVTPVSRRYRVFYRIENGRKVEIRRVLLSERTGATYKRDVAASDGVYRRMRRHFAEMGIADSLVDLALTAKPDSMRWLTAEEASKSALVGSTRAPAELIRPAGAAAASSAATATSSASTLAARASHGAVAAGMVTAGEPIASARVAMPWQAGRKLELEIDVEHDAATGLVVLFVQPRLETLRLRAERMTLLIEPRDQPPLLALRGEGHPAFAPLRATMPLAAFCRMRGVGKVAFSLEIIEGELKNASPIVHDESRLAIEMKPGPARCPAG